MVGNYSLNVKEHFPYWAGHPRAMSGKTINQVVADNLRYWMAQAKMTQAALAEKAGVDQKTISNYLNPEQRTEGSRGKEPSARLSELDKVARALRVELWQLTRSMSARERAMYEAIERAYSELRASAGKDADQEEERQAVAALARNVAATKPRAQRRKKSA